MRPGKLLRWTFRSVGRMLTVSDSQRTKLGVKEKKSGGAGSNPFLDPQVFCGTDVESVCLSLVLRFGSLHNTPIISQSVCQMDRAKVTGQTAARGDDSIRSLSLTTISRFVQICHLPPYRYSSRRGARSTSVCQPRHTEVRTHTPTSAPAPASHRPSVLRWSSSK